MNRKYNIPDSRLLEHTGVIMEALENDLPSFTTFDADLSVDLVTDLSTQYKTSLAEGGDGVVRGMVGEKTQSLHDEEKRADELIRSLRYWTKKAFAKNPAALKRFQLTKYWKAKNQQSELVTYMNTLATVVAEFRVPLETAKVPVDLLDSVKTIADALTKANSIQENSKGGRNSATQERVMRLNAIYEIDLLFSQAANFVYDNDPAKRDFYRLPSSKSNNGAAPEESE